MTDGGPLLPRRVQRQRPNPLTAEKAVELFKACKIGKEKIGGETASDLLARTATRTLAVTTAAISGESSGLPGPIRKPLQTVRGLALMIYLFVGTRCRASGRAR